MTIDDVALARALHVLGVVLWIGGVGLVTTVLLPAVRRFKAPAERIAFFAGVEGRFSRQAKLTTLLTGATGLYMLYAMDAWARFTEAAYWWMYAMVLVWAVFTLVLFVLEPLVLHRWLLARGGRDPEGTLAIIQRLHWLLLTISAVTILGAVAGVHG